ncbi:MAG: MarR family transcriptional regulator [Firmicutes bacterium]|nr:MarR family transcriptional regulator [Bacillota bacterium]
MELEQCINFLLTKVQQSVHQLFKAELEPYGVTPGQYAILKCLWDNNGQSVKQLAERLSLDSSTITSVLDRLEQKGLIERHPDLHDRRALQVIITDKGRSLEEPLTQAIIEANKKAMKLLGDAEGRRLKQLLDVNRADVQ